MTRLERILSEYLKSKERDPLIVLVEYILPHPADRYAIQKFFTRSGDVWVTTKGKARSALKSIEKFKSDLEKTRNASYGSIKYE